nr:hypothetical protein [Micromonospora sp. DSM 115978]
RTQRVEAFEAVRDVDARGAGEQAEVEVTANDRGDPQEVAATVVEARHPIPDDVAHGRRHPASGRRLAFGEHTAVDEKPQQFKDNEGIAGGADMDVAGGVRAGLVAGLTTDEFGHVGQAERAETDPAVTVSPAGGRQYAGKLG